MSVAILKADDELGYWEYSVLTEEHGEWNLQFSRGEKAGTPHTERDDLHFLHVSIKREGEDIFSTWGYGETPFLSHHEVNSMIAASALANLARWYSASAEAHEIDETKKRIQQALSLIPGVETADDAVIFVGDMPILPEEARITPSDCRTLGPYGKDTHAVYMELFHHGMVTTTPEWRIGFLHEENPEPHCWGCDHDHEHE